MHLRYIATFLLLLFLTSEVQAQASGPSSYFPGRVIVKYKSTEEIGDIRAKGVQDPRDQVLKILNEARMTQSRSFWNPSLSPSPSILNQNPAVANARDELRRIREVSYLGDVDPAILAAKLSRLPAVDYAEPKYIRQLQYQPDDPVDNPYLNFHKFEAAWDINRGSPDVIIAIVDGGVGYLHPELSNKLWVNGDEIPSTQRSQVDSDSDGTITSAEVLDYLQQNNEDADGNGVINLRDAVHPNSSLTTGSDTDGNGFADDLYGWDFWDSGGVSSPVQEDNDPIHDGTDHGTHVGGIAAADTDNGQGIYSTGFNSRFMAVKAGGRPDDPGTERNEAQAVGFGFEGIIYAAEQGADIINASWGGGSFSEAENDVIEFATAMGSLVVSVAGNNSNDEVIYPAAYSSVLAVGSVETDNRVADYSNFGYKLDVLATGSGIQSAEFNDNIGSKTGTSMAAPVVAGLAGLIRSRFPGWSPQRIAAQIRSTAIPVDQQNTSRYEHKLGRGKVDAFTALNTPMPGIAISSFTFLNSDGQKLALGEEGRLVLNIINYGESTDNLVLNLQNIEDQAITLNETSKQIGSIGTDQSAQVTFSLRIHESFDLSTLPVVRVNFSDANTGYSDFGIVVYEDILFDVMAANNIKTSFASDGTAGFTNPFTGEGGVGFITRENASENFVRENNILFEGGLMMSIDGEVFDAVRSVNGGLSRDFNPRGVFRVESPGQLSTVDGAGLFAFGDSTDVRRAEVELQTYAFDDPSLSNVVYMQYTVRNPSSFVVLKEVYLGLFHDWDIGDAFNNGISYSPADSVLYAFDESQNSTWPMVAAAQLGNVSSLLAIDNAMSGQADSVTFGIYDGYTDSEKLSSLKAGTLRTSASNTDVSAVAASGPYELGPNAEISVGFIYAFGSDLNELRTQVARARQQAPFEVSDTGLSISDRVPPSTRLFPNYPNPFSTTTQLRIDLQQPQDITLTIYDVLGRKVRVLVSERLEARTHIFTFNGEHLSSGVYFARLKTGDGVQTVPMTFIK